MQGIKKKRKEYFQYAFWEEGWSMRVPSMSMWKSFEDFYSWNPYPCPREEIVVCLYDLEDWYLEPLLDSAALAMPFCLIQNKEAEYNKSSELLRKFAM